MRSNKILLITGASSGFGEAAARRFAAQGHRVIAAARRGDRLNALAQAYPEQIHPLVLDVSDRQAVFAAVQALPAELRSIDVLVNNAGLAAGLDPAHQANLDDWDAMIAANCNGLVYVTRAVLPAMVARGDGQIINIGSIAGEVPYPGGNVYGATKAFVRQFTQNLNADLIGSGVRATCIEPGLCGDTEFSLVRFKGDKERSAKVYEGTTPLTSEDIADTIEWLIERPAHVNINVISMLPNCQSFAPLAIKRT